MQSSLTKIRIRKPKSCRLKFHLFILFIGLCTAGSVLINIKPINALSISDWNAGRIIDYGLFTDSTTMDAGQIQQFLNVKVPICDTMGTQSAADWGRPDLNHAQYAASRGWPAPPYPCLKDYTENGLSSAQIIYNVAQRYNINPQVLIVLLQKEQGLITDTWPLPVQYKTATGYGCPDTSECEAKYFGLTAQLYWAGTLFHAVVTDNQTWSNPYGSGTSWFSPYTLGSNSIYYNPNVSCGSSVVDIQNRATQSLYDYTPYQPNSATLNWGLSGGPSVSSSYPDCGAFGNINFFTYFNNWFGSTTEPASFKYSVTSREMYYDNEYKNKVPDTSIVEPNQELYMKILIKNTGNQTWYKKNLHLGTSGPQDRASLFVSNEWLGPNRPSSMTEDYVSADGTATFMFKIKTPTYLGEYKEQFGVLIEGYRWLDSTFTVPITVASSTPYYSMQTVSFDTYSDVEMTKKISNSNVTKYTNSKIYIKAVVKNTGNQTYPALSTILAPSNPIDRNSIFSDSSWIGGSRTTIAKEGDILPQGTGTYTFSITTPSTPLIRTQEQFGLLIENVQWLNYNIGSLSVQTNKRPPTSLNTNQVLETNEALLSGDERYALILQGDGNLVLYSPSRPLWASNTVGRGGTKLIIQSDGNLVIYDKNWSPVWSSRTNGKGTSSLQIQNDGNLVIYNNTSYTWATWTVNQT